MSANRKPITPDMLEFGRYRSGELSIEIFLRGVGSALTPELGMKATTATVALLEYGHPRPRFGCVWLKTWSENEGIAEALVSGGCVELTGRSTVTGRGVVAQEAKLTSEALKVLAEQGGFLSI